VFTRKLLPAILLALLVLKVAPAQALLCGSVLDPMSVTGSTLAFGNYTGASAVNFSSTLQINCAIPIDVLPVFTLGISAGASGTATQRYMNASGQHLKYNIYSNSLGTAILGDGLNGAPTLGYAGLLSIGTSFTAYGVIPAGQYVTPGPYSDTITITVSY
jgi:spore coat protein U-like protein